MMPERAERHPCPLPSGDGVIIENTSRPGQVGHRNLSRLAKLRDPPLLLGLGSSPSPRRRRRRRRSSLYIRVRVRVRGGGGEGFVFKDTIEGPRAPAVKPGRERHSSLMSEGCSTFSGCRTIRLCSCWPSEDPPTSLRSPPPPPPPPFNDRQRNTC